MDDALTTDVSDVDGADVAVDVDVVPDVVPDVVDVDSVAEVASDVVDSVVVNVVDEPPVETGIGVYDVGSDS